MLLSNCIYMYSAFAPKIDLKCSIPFLASYSLDIFMGFLFYLVLAGSCVTLVGIWLVENVVVWEGC